MMKESGIFLRELEMKWVGDHTVQESQLKQYPRTVPHPPPSFTSLTQLSPRTSKNPIYALFSPACAYGMSKRFASLPKSPQTREESIRNTS
jgi:hypothetical protein